MKGAQGLLCHHTALNLQPLSPCIPAASPHVQNSEVYTFLSPFSASPQDLKNPDNSLRPRDSRTASLLGHGLE
jgi:hypothetical protein